MESAHSPKTKGPVILILAAASILLITMGIRQSMGLFVLPIVSATHLSIVAVSFALAVGQLVWGIGQPITGAIADQYGARRVMVAGALLLAAGTALTPWVSSEWGLISTLGILMAAGAAAGSFSILIGVVARHLRAEKRSMATGLINAGGSVGQFALAPFSQILISGPGWRVAMWALSVSALATIPLTWLLCRKQDQQTAQLDAVLRTPQPQVRLADQLRIAMRDPSYLCLHAGFFTCGFHIAFLVTHLPGDLQLCGLSATVAANSLALIGLFNVAGSITAGWLGQRYRMKNLLVLLYASRAAIVVCYLLMPKTALNVYLVAGALGFTWLATVPPTAGLVGKLFGTRYLATLFGLTLLSHQIGGFLGAWLGGVAIAQLGSYDWIWYADIALALLAAFVNLPIREAKIIAQPALAS
jgi:predicted MFS family arabinose efflux permease